MTRHRSNSPAAATTVSDASKGAPELLRRVFDPGGDVYRITENGKLQPGIITYQPAIDLPGVDADPDPDRRIKAAFQVPPVDLAQQFAGTQEGSSGIARAGLRDAEHDKRAVPNELVDDTACFPRCLQHPPAERGHEDRQPHGIHMLGELGRVPHVGEENAHLLAASLAPDRQLIRVHQGGDFGWQESRKLGAVGRLSHGPQKQGPGPPHDHRRDQAREGQRAPSDQRRHDREEMVHLLAGSARRPIRIEPKRDDGHGKTEHQQGGCPNLHPWAVADRAKGQQEWHQPDARYGREPVAAEGGRVEHDIQPERENSRVHGREGERHPRPEQAGPSESKGCQPHKQEATQCNGYDTEGSTMSSDPAGASRLEGNRDPDEENKSHDGSQQADHLFGFQLGLGDQLFGERGWHRVLRNGPTDVLFMKSAAANAWS